MGKKGKNRNSELGKALIKDKLRQRSQPALLQPFSTDPTAQPTNKLKSVIEQKSLEEFLTDAILKGEEFTSERGNPTIILNSQPVLEDDEEEEEDDADKMKILVSGNWVQPNQNESAKASIDDENIQVVASQIPRRPEWDHTTTTEQLNQNEYRAFLEWRRNLAELQEKNDLMMTPFEKNLEVWRQLWRVVERSDVVVQVIDARNPLMFRSVDLERYVQEVDPTKKNLLLINKSDLLPLALRKEWADYFDSVGVKYIFFSAKSEQIRLKSEEEKREENKEKKEENKENVEPTTTTTATTTTQNDKYALLDAHALLDLFKSLTPAHKENISVGMVGFPNVGKSSTINVIVGSKRVAVSSTPGKTKHFQTIVIDEHLTLCDCPGLVFPRLASSKAEMVLDGILPIDQLRDPYPAIQILCSRFSRDYLQEFYGCTFPLPVAGEPQNRTLYATELLSSYAMMRGFMTARALPDEARAARVLLKDYFNAFLLYCHYPPSNLSVERGSSFPGLSRSSYSTTEVKAPQRPQRKDLNSTPQYDDDEIFREQLANVKPIINSGGKKKKKTKNAQNVPNGILGPAESHHLPVTITELRKIMKNQKAKSKVAAGFTTTNQNENDLLTHSQGDKKKIVSFGV